MKPAWDQLMEAYTGHATAVVADVDCTADGKSLCDMVGVRGYPSIKWGSPDDLQDYKGGRTFDALKKFADESLKPMCGPANLDLCDDAKKAKITVLMQTSDAELDAMLSSIESAISLVEQTFKDGVAVLDARYKELSANKGPDFDAEVDKLRATHKELTQAKEEASSKAKDAGHSLMKSVKAARAKAGTGKTDL
ncbi:unnamed protein product [Polarella glacialis]|uniref:Thioredoxin domain-containing protein n=1 Tax=Polarella glacialis TaxID=89957 RepID=A0A813GP51_POLGL|nr:unnamed protein product [Polarella glacialis]CAE8722352.1 unnamed protein product [Polarella glacialis]|mmetsp:Transcript_32493/g.58325  ORF Transcript_32493/g.58325 Transcript_32493/m.58325 type:complete len:194 (+) Transcript_32493:240-821(+)